MTLVQILTTNYFATSWKFEQKDNIDGKNEHRSKRYKEDENNVDGKNAQDHFISEIFTPLHY